MTTRIRLHPIRTGQAGQIWSAVNEATGETIVEAKYPEGEVARILLDRGVTDPMEIFVGDRTFPSYRVEVAEAAKWTISEGTRSTVKRVLWVPFRAFEPA